MAPNIHIAAAAVLLSLCFCIVQGQISEYELVNPSSKPIPAASFIFESHPTESDKPWSYVDVSGDPLPQACFNNGQKTATEVFFDLEPYERKVIQRVEGDLSAQETSPFLAQWDGARGVISNGLLTISANASGRLTFAAPGTSDADSLEILSSMYLDGGIAPESVGRKQATSAEAFGVQPLDTRKGNILEGRATMVDGAPQLEILKDYPDLPGIQTREIWQMQADAMIASYAVELENHSEEEVHLVNFQDFLYGVFGEALAGNILLREAVGPAYRQEVEVKETMHRLYGQFQLPTMLYTLRNPDSGVGFGISYLDAIKPKPGEQTPSFLGETYLYVGQNLFALEPVDVERGPLPLGIAAGESVRVGYRLFVTEPGPDPWLRAFRQFQHLAGRASMEHIEIDGGFTVMKEGKPLKVASIPIEVGQPLKLAMPCLWHAPSESSIEASEPGLTLKKKTAADAVFSFPVKVDLHNRYILEADLNHLSGGSSVKLEARVGGETFLLGEWDQTGSESVKLPADLKEHVRWSQPRAHWDPADKTLHPDRTPVTFLLTLSGPAGAQASFAKLLIRRAPPEAPELISPVDGMSLTDIAVSYKWRKVPGTTHYQIELAAANGFEGAKRIEVESDHGVARYLPPPTELLAPGEWFWRIRAVRGDGVPGDWSKVRSFSVNNDRKLRPLEYQYNADNPLFLFEAWRVPDLADFKEVIPADLRDNSALVVGEWNAHYPSMTAQEYFAPLREHEIPAFIINLGPNETHAWDTLADLEWIFQNIPSVRGMIMFEAWGITDKVHYKGEPLREQIQAAVRLCAKYGKHFAWVDGMWGESKFPVMASHPEFAWIWQNLSEYLIIGHKTTIGPSGLTSMMFSMGMWLAGLNDTLMLWMEPWYWGLAGFRELDVVGARESGIPEKMPPVFWAQQALVALTQGASVYVFGGQHTATLGTESVKTDIGEYPGPALYDNQGRTTKAFEDVIIPFLRGVVRQSLIPAKDEVVEEIQAVIELSEMPDKNHVPDGEWGPYEKIFAEVFEVEPKSASYDLIPNALAYGYTPIIPHGWQAPDGLTGASLEDLQTTQGVQSLLDRLLAKEKAKDVFQFLSKDLLVLMSTEENRSTDGAFDIRPGFGPLKGLSGRIGPHLYLVAKYFADQNHVWIQVNGSPRAEPWVLHLKLEQGALLTTASGESAFDLEEMDGDRVLQLPIDGKVKEFYIELNR